MVEPLVRGVALSDGGGTPTGRGAARPDDWRAIHEVSGPRGYVLAHLGQSIDGYIAGADGQSRGLNGHENIIHLHRLRALFQAIVVGGNTAAVDDPSLTTRLVAGENPVRVVLDCHLRCSPELQLFNDNRAPTYIVCADDAPPRQYPTGVAVLRLNVPRARWSVRHVLDALAAEGLYRVFIEGGGVTVSRCIEAGVLDRLQITVAPLLIGRGTPGVQLSNFFRFDQALRPKCRRFTLGEDVLFDFDLHHARVMTST